MTSEKDIYAIGECASWRGNVSSLSTSLIGSVADPPYLRYTDLRTHRSGSRDGGYSRLQPRTLLSPSPPKPSPDLVSPPHRLKRTATLLAR